MRQNNRHVDCGPLNERFRRRKNVQVYNFIPSSSSSSSNNIQDQCLIITDIYGVSSSSSSNNIQDQCLIITDIYGVSSSSSSNNIQDQCLIITDIYGVREKGHMLKLLLLC